MSELYQLMRSQLYKDVEAFKQFKPIPLLFTQKDYDIALGFHNDGIAVLRTESGKYYFNNMEVILASNVKWTL